MTQELQPILEKIQRDGIGKAREEADKIIRNEYRVTIIRAIAADLENRGITTNPYMIAGEVLEYFDRLHLEPTNPADALGIFLGLEGELELRKIIRRNS